MNKFYLHYLLAKGHQADLYQLKVLPAKGDADNGDIKQNTEEDMDKRGANAPTEYPDDVEDEGQATAIAATADHLFTKRRQYQPRQLKALQAKRYTHNGKAQQYPTP